MSSLPAPPARPWQQTVSHWLAGSRTLRPVIDSQLPRAITSQSPLVPAAGAQQIRSQRAGAETSPAHVARTVSGVQVPALQQQIRSHCTTARGVQPAAVQAVWPRTCERDIVTLPRVMRHIASRIPGAIYFEIPGATHYAVMEHPRLVANRIESFVRGHP